MPLLLALMRNYELHCGDNQAHSLTKLPLGQFLSTGTPLLILKIIVYMWQFDRHFFLLYILAVT